MRSSDLARHNAQRAREIAASASHDERMEVICARGGINLKKFRRMGISAQASFMADYRDGGWAGH